MSSKPVVAIEAPGPGEPLVVVEGSIPDTPPTGVVVKVHCTGICHSDVHVWQDKVKLSEQMTLKMNQLNPNFKWPHILGHEVSGEIHSVGSEATSSGLAVGDRVAVYPWVGCGACGLCTHGHTNLCPASIGFDIGVGVAGGFQCYLGMLNVNNVKKIPDSINMDVACMFGCSALTSYNACQRVLHSIERAAKASGEARFLIVGAGGLGLWTIQCAKAMFPSNAKIFVADVDEEKLKQAKEHGADETILWARDAEEASLVEKTKEVTGGGIDASVDYVGITKTLNRCFQAARKGSTLVMVGLAGGTAEISLVELALKDITLAGIYVGNVQQMSELMALYAEKQIKPPPMVHVKPEGAAEAIQNLKDGKVLGRGIIQFV